MLRASVQALQRCLRSSAHEHLLLSVFGSSAQQLRNTTCGLTHPDGASCSGRSWLAVSFGRSAFASAAETSGELVIHDSAVQVSTSHVKSKIQEKGVVTILMRLFVGRVLAYIASDINVEHAWLCW